MAEGTYEYECMRAELLGVEKPDYEEFLKKLEEAKLVEEENQATEHLKAAEETGSDLQHVAGRLDELNSILKQTQDKISRFKVSCGSSLTNLFKNRLGQSISSSRDEVQLDAAIAPITSTDDVKTDDEEEFLQRSTNESSVVGARKSDLTRALDKHVDHLDALLDKAENAHYSMAHQNKEIKKFLN